MSVLTMPDVESFRTEVLRGLPGTARVNRENRTIYGAKAMQIGPLNAGDSRPWKVDQTTLEQLKGLVNAKGTGTKMRFSHPNMSRDGMGKHLGRANNARILSVDGEPPFVAVDARMSEAATRSPGGNLAQHVLDLAEETPEDFGLSIAPILDYEAMKKIEPDEKGLIPIRLKSLRAIDVVDEPAATSGGLFSLNSDSLSDLPAQVTSVLDTFFSESPADVIRARFNEFLNTYLQSRGDSMTVNKHEESTPATQPSTPSATPVAVPVVATEPNQQQVAAAELSRRSELSALCQLAKVSDADRDLMIAAGFSRADAQQWLKSSGKLNMNSPSIPEGGSQPEKKEKTPQELFGEEHDATPDIFAMQGITREQYIASRMKDK